MATGPNVVINIRGDGESAKRALEMVEQKLRETREKAQAESKLTVAALEMMGQAFNNIVGLGGLIGIEQSLKTMVTSSVALGVEMNHLAKETGISTETLSVIKYASDSTGVSFEALTKGTAKLSKSMLDADEGNKKAVNSFARLGITQAQVEEKSHDLYGMLGLLADKFQALPDGPLKAAEAMALFGKSGAVLVPFLNEGSQGIERLRTEAQSLGLVLDEQAVTKLAEMQKEGVKLQGALQGLALTLTSDLGPSLEGAAELMSALIGKFRELAGMKDDSPPEFSALPKELAGLEGEELNSARIRAANARDAAKAELDDLEQKHAKGALSVADYNKKKLSLEKDYFSQQKMMYSAMFLDQQDATQRAADAVASAQKQHGGFLSMIGVPDPDLEQAKENLENQQRALNSLRKDMVGADKGLAAAKPKQDLSLQDQSKGKPGKTDDPIVRAASDLVREQATAAADAQKQATQAMLAELETQHKMLLVSDTDFYQEKLRLQVAALEAEKAALDKQGAELQALYEKQRGDKLLKRDKQGNSAEELRTQREILQVQERIGEVQAKSQALGSQSNAEIFAAAQAQELAGLRAAADLERERDAGLAARLALLQRENELQVQKVKAAGGGDAEVDQVRQLGEVAAQKLRIAELDRQIRDSEQDNRRAVDELNDAAAKDPRLKVAAARQINQLNADEARQLAVLAQQYDALAATLGGEFIQKARDLHAELDKLNRPDNKEDAAFTKSLVEGLEGISNKMVETAGTGRNAFHEMAMSIEKDLLRLALKLAEEKWITPMLNGAAGGKLPVRPTFAPGISAQPQTPSGGVFASAAGALGSAAAGGFKGDGDDFGGDADAGGDDEGSGGGPSGIAGLLGGIGKKLLGGGKGGAPGVTINITNTTGSDVSASQTGASYNADAKEFVIHAVLENAGSGGVLSHLFGGG